MQLYEISEITDAFYILETCHHDKRGQFQEIFHKEKAAELSAYWSETDWGQQVSLSNSKAGVVRGIHRTPYPKYVACVSGTVYDVIVDLREDSPTYLNWNGRWLTGANIAMADAIRVFIPAGCGHGFFAAEDDSMLLYLQPEVYQPDQDESYHWQSFGIEWPKRSKYLLSKKDEQAPKFDGKPPTCTV